MKVITITSENINDVYGRLHKFFYNKNRTGFEEWHNFNCGFKKHISPYIYIDGKKERVVNVYPSPDEVELVIRGGQSWIVVRLMSGHGFVLQCGDKIAFCGNRIIHRSKWMFGGYEYEVFQAYKMSEEKQQTMKYYAEMEHKAWENEMMEDEWS